MPCSKPGIGTADARHHVCRGGIVAGDGGQLGIQAHRHDAIDAETGISDGLLDG